MRINLSESAFVSCRAEGNPEPTTRIENSTGVVLDSDHKGWVNYEFQNVTYDRAGNYRCIASNTIDSIKRSRVQPFEVIIQGKLLTLCIII